VMNCKGFEQKRLWYNRGTTSGSAWRDSRLNLVGTVGRDFKQSEFHLHAFEVPINFVGTREFKVCTSIATSECMDRVLSL
jgi:hypothetical protein